jgi:hypothetical protein
MINVEREPSFKGDILAGNLQRSFRRGERVEELTDSQAAPTLLGSVFIAEIAFYSRSLLVREHPVVDQNFADLAIEICVVDAGTNCACSGHTTERMQLSGLGQDPKAVDINLVGFICRGQPG